MLHTVSTTFASLAILWEALRIALRSGMGKSAFGRVAPTAAADPEWCFSSSWCGLALANSAQVSVAAVAIENTRNSGKSDGGAETSQPWRQRAWRSRPL